MMKKIAAYAEPQEERFSKVVSQSNHDGGRIPEELSDFADMPLYILIALWCCRRKTWIDRKQISVAFGITKRRASFQISYIIRKSEIIHHQARKTKAPGSRRLSHEILVENVFLPSVNEKKSPQISTSYKRQLRDSIYQNDMRWLLSRSIPGKS